MKTRAHGESDVSSDQDSDQSGEATRQVARVVRPAPLTMPPAKRRSQ